MNDDYTRFLSLIELKSVALVGNAVSSMDQQNGRAIDAHDVVIRCNRSFLRCQPNTIGMKTTILFLGSPGQAGDYMSGKFDANKIDAFVWTKSVESGQRLKKSCPTILKHPGLLWYDMSFKQHLTDTVCGGALPTAGFMAFRWLLGCPCYTSLTLFGFDFFRTGTAYSGLNRAKKWHNPDAEKADIELAIANQDLKISFVPC